MLRNGNVIRDTKRRPFNPGRDDDFRSRTRNAPYRDLAFESRFRARVDPVAIGTVERKLRASPVLGAYADLGIESMRVDGAAVVVWALLSVHYAVVQAV